MAGTSGLLKSAASVRNQLATYQDSLMAYEYSQSAFTDSAYSQYSAYLNSRINSLNAAPSISNMSRALTLTKAATGAMKSNVSATIQRENIQVLSGNASLQDKYNVIAQQFVRAQTNGDMTLAQTLEGQAYSLSQSIQYQAQQSAAAGVALANANAASEGNVVTNLQNGLKQLDTILQNTGQKDFNSTIQSWVKDNQATFTALGVNIPAGAQPNYWNVVNGVMGAMYNHNMLAYQYLASTDPQAAKAYKDKATQLFNGGTTISTLGGDVNAQQVQDAMANPSKYAYDASTGKFILSQQTGYQTNPAAPMNPQPTYNGSVEHTVVLSPTQTAQMATLGLQFKVDTSTGAKQNTAPDGVQVQATSASPQWLRNILGDNGVTNIYTQSNSATNKDMLQFQADSVSGHGKAIYTVAGDGSTWESSALGDKLIYGSPAAPKQPTSVFGQISDAFMSGAKNIADMFGAKAYADSLPASMMSKYAAPNSSLATLPAIPVAQPVQLPSISVIAPPPQAALTVKAAPTITPAVQTTSNPQPAAQGTSVQGGSSGMSLQGGGFSLQGGGAGISLQ